jgi:hypothetical protein
MDQPKIENFEKEFPGKKFASISSLERERRTHVFDSIKSKFNSDAVDGAGLVKDVWARGRQLKGFDCCAADFDLKLFFDRLALRNIGDVYLNWRYYDLVGKIKFTDLVQYFSDIWYPDVDDLDIFDDSFDWVVMIRHDGQVRFARHRFVGIG